METTVYLLFLILYAAGVFLALRLSRPLRTCALPQTLFAVAVLHEPEGLEEQLAALAAQRCWTDSALVHCIWLVDATPGGVLMQACQEFCHTHAGFCCCSQADFVKNFGKMTEAEKNDCNLSKKKV